LKRAADALLAAKSADERTTAANEFILLSEEYIVDQPNGCPCRVYWGSHGCRLERGHGGPHLCGCADEAGVDLVTRRHADGSLNVGAPPYYGPDTNFYGEDATDASPQDPG
jgi:hypothetical protein